MPWVPDAEQYAAIQRYTEQVEAERDRLRAALEDILDPVTDAPGYVRRIARRALEDVGPKEEAK